MCVYWRKDRIVLTVWTAHFCIYRKIVPVIYANLLVLAYCVKEGRNIRVNIQVGEICSEKSNNVKCCTQKSLIWTLCVVLFFAVLHSRIAFLVWRILWRNTFLQNSTSHNSDLHEGQKQFIYNIMKEYWKQITINRWFRVSVHYWMNAYFHVLADIVIIFIVIFILV